MIIPKIGVMPDKRHTYRPPTSTGAYIKRRAIIVDGHINNMNQIYKRTGKNFDS